MPPSAERPSPEGTSLEEPSLEDAAVDDVLAHGRLELEGRLAVASNVSFLGSATLDGVTVRCIYKPTAGERPLWDFPDGTLADRERAARVVSEIGGWQVVPPTVLRDGRFGRGMVQQWVEVDPDIVLVDVVEDTFDEPGWIAVLEAEDRAGDPVLLVHADDPRLRSMAVLDVVLNNADRKGGHLLPEGVRVRGCDHGVTFHRDVKLRTVLWGWADEPLREEDVAALHRVREALDRGAADGEARGVVRGDDGKGAGGELATLLDPGELSALNRRVARLLRDGVMPSPHGRWPAIPWPAI